MVFLKFGSTGEKVKELQAHIGGLVIDGYYGRITEAAVKNFQKKNGYEATGEITYTIWNQIFGVQTSTDSSEKKILITHDGDFPIYAHQHYLSSDEYVDEVTAKKEYIFLHHTAGWNNPYNTVRGWERDSRGRIGTQFVIGGVGHYNRSSKYNGVIVECFPNENWAYHLGSVNKYMHKHSVGIELCSFGRLTKRGSRYYNWIGKEVHSKQVHSLTKPFKNQLHFHRYSKKQVRAAKDLILYLGDLHKIDYTKGLLELLSVYGDFPEKAFEFSVDAKLGKLKGVLSHSNVRTDKDDVYPDPYLINTLSKLV